VTGLLEALRANPAVLLGPERRTTIDGLPARQMTVRTRPGAKRLPFCATPCAALYGRKGWTMTLIAPGRGRLTVLDIGGTPLALYEDTHADQRSLAETGALLRSLRIAR
jgi:hypothetical protein